MAKQEVKCAHGLRISECAEHWRIFQRETGSIMEDDDLRAAISSFQVTLNDEDQNEVDIDLGELIEVDDIMLLVKKRDALIRSGVVDEVIKLAPTELFYKWSKKDIADFFQALGKWEREQLPVIQHAEHPQTIIDDIPPQDGPGGS